MKYGICWIFKFTKSLLKITSKTIAPTDDGNEADLAKLPSFKVERETIEHVPLADLLRDVVKNGNVVDMLIMDIEGAEFSVLEAIATPKSKLGKYFFKKKNSISE
jgi:hypothetical protein